MAQSIIINALCNKRAELAGLAADLESKLRQIRTDMDHLDATILLFDPTIKPVTIRAKAPPPARSPHFEPGEIARRCRDALRVAGPSGVSAAELAATAMAEKGISGDDASADFTQRMYWTLTRIGREGTARKAGAGHGARWTLMEE